MNYYTIKSTEPEGYVLDKTKLSYPAHVMDLRTGLTYVLETSSSEPIIVGGKVQPKQVIGVLLVTIEEGEENYFGTVMTPYEYEDYSEVSEFTHTAIALFDEGTVNINDGEDLEDAKEFSDWILIPITSSAVEAQMNY